MLNIFKSHNKQENQIVNVQNINNVDNNLVIKLKQHFSDEEQQLYVTNLYMYMNYHPTQDYPINLEDVYKMIGFANKGNAKRTLENNFIKDEDYKKLLLPTEKQLVNGKDLGGIDKIRKTIENLDNECKIKINAPTGGVGTTHSDTWFLTEDGVD